MARRGKRRDGTTKYAAICKSCDSKRVSNKKKAAKKKKRQTKLHTKCEKVGVIDVTEHDLVVLATNEECKLADFMKLFVNAINGVWYENKK